MPVVIGMIMSNFMSQTKAEKEIVVK